ncbi:Malic enzyme [Blattamonas nauphoetae]|uniref:Malic enzyme n=1 Tax=Blattamonas nauphoetae TaxID=2049346 RepID=A0ABQ9YGA1_9EUKA|nr:Malic enzyme [Blattamonas nauphoetae]
MSSMQVLHEPYQSAMEVFTPEQRTKHHMRGLLPATPLSPEAFEKRILADFDAETDPLKKFLILSDLADRSLHLYYYVITRNFGKLNPFIYTPTVGLYCQKYHLCHRPKRVLYYTLRDEGHIDEITSNWPQKEVDIVVMTDGGRILGLGDQGANGIGIPIGKLALYCAAAGSDPEKVLPVQIDVGTSNMKLRDDPLYLGLNQDRLRGDAYYAFVGTVVESIHKRWPKALIQFEDFGMVNALDLLDIWRNKILSFNDDIQGTGAVTLAALINACRARGKTVKDLVNDRILFAGAGSAAVGIADAIVAGMVVEGVPKEEAVKSFFFVNTKGLVGKGRTDLNPSQIRYQRQDFPGGTDLIATAKAIKPTIVIGVSGTPNQFTEELVSIMKENTPCPIIFPLSNPTSQAECTAEQVFAWTGGKAVFAAGSPFAPVTKDGVTLHTNQCNNMYIFPALGLAAAKVHATRVTDRMLYRSAAALAEQVSEEEVKKGILFPPLSQIRDISHKIATAVVHEAMDEGVVPEPPCKKEEVHEWLRTQMYDPAKKLAEL